MYRRRFPRCIMPLPPPLTSFADDETDYRDGVSA
jgi:hypothetical protein